MASLTACNDDNGTNRQYPVNSFAKIQLTENIRSSDAPTVTNTQTYRFQSGLLSTYAALQTMSVAGEKVEIANNATVNYGGNQAIVADDAGNISTYILNEQGYAISCTRLEGGGSTRQYTFGYDIHADGKHYLKSITETGADGTLYASIDIDRSTVHTLRITQHVDRYNQTFTATSDGTTANPGEIPFLFLTDMYPLTLHNTALYGKLLGEPEEELMTGLVPDGNAGSNETITYTYDTDQRGIITACHEVTKSYGTSYTRTVNYAIE